MSTNLGIFIPLPREEKEMSDDGTSSLDSTTQGSSSRSSIRMLYVVTSVLVISLFIILLLVSTGCECQVDISDADISIPKGTEPL